MTLFISYAHREALICHLIVYALKARGHKVWFDELNIPHGSDWRSEILKGIERSSGVLSMLSRDAVKLGGVCLDELSIAVGVRGGNIRTILLEQDVTPPPTIMSRQWLDLIAAAVNPFSFAEAAGRHSFRECPDPGAQSFRRRICKHSVGKLDIAAFLRKNDQRSEGFGLSF